jgi:hypothetical protein
MKPIPGVILVAAVSLGIAAAAVTAGDVNVLVPTPETVAENYVRQLDAKRYKPAHSLLAEETRATNAVASLRDVALALQSTFGPIDTIKGVGETYAGNEAAALVEVSGKHKTGIVHVPLRREKGVWRVAKATLIDEAGS